MISFRFRLSRDRSTSYSSSVASMSSVVSSCSGAVPATSLEFVPILPSGAFDDSGLLNPFLDLSKSRLSCEISISVVRPFVLVAGAFAASLAGAFQLAMESLFGSLYL